MSSALRGASGGKEAVAPNGDVWMVNDNDGVDDSNGETQLWNLGDILP